MFVIKEYNEKDSAAFAQLNREWIEKYFEIEPQDELVFADPKAEILDKGGRIFYLYLDSVVVGTVSLIKESDSVFEVAKMAITESIKGKGGGNLLLEHLISEAKKMGISKLELTGNTKLEASIHLYKKFGFREIPLKNMPFKRGNIKMELVLK